LFRQFDENGDHDGSRRASSRSEVPTGARTHHGRVERHRGGAREGIRAEPGAPAELFSQLAADNIAVDALVNSAGFNVHGRFVETDLRRELEMLQLQVTAVTHLTKLFLRQMPDPASGMLLNVASVAAFVPGPLVSVHFASRAFTLHFSEALADELRGTGIRVTCLCPGPTRSEFFGRAGMERVRLATGRPIELMDPRTVAQVGYHALKQGRAVVVPGARNRALALLSRIAPRHLVIRVTRWLMEPT
jgi:short-subunit dehydrogenase